MCRECDMTAIVVNASDGLDEAVSETSRLWGAGWEQDSVAQSGLHYCA